MDAFAGESQANRKYLAFSEKAAAEGFKNIATLYKAASDAEAIHAKKLLKVLGAINATEKNLEGSIEGETHEYTSMYPAFIKDAESEKKSDAVLAFTHAMKAEEVHAGLYKKALAALKAGHELAGKRSTSARSAAILRSGRPLRSARSAEYLENSSTKLPFNTFFRYPLVHPLHPAICLRS